MQHATGSVRCVRVLGERFQPSFHLRRKPRLNHATPLGFRHVWVTANVIILSRPYLITVVVILYVHDVVQSAGLFRVAVSLSSTTSWITRIVRPVSYKNRTRRVVHGVGITCVNPERAGWTPLL